ncbi:hypothetical protein [Pseudomonas mandelii]|nr:hypothetical protein [Pseudomonas mandelii]MCX2899078.1 hypothetical protein [Pseudomonas mandelii]
MNALAFVGAGLLAKNDDAVFLLNRSACFASKPAPTVIGAEGRDHG